MADVASSLCQWWQWWGCAQELGVVLPDPVVLPGVLTKASDVIAKTSAQIAYRLSMCRQQLGMDTRPTVDSIKTFAEVMQPEAEELTLGVNSSGGL